MNTKKRAGEVIDGQLLVPITIAMTRTSLTKVSKTNVANPETIDADNGNAVFMASLLRDETILMGKFTNPTRTYHMVTPKVRNVDPETPSNVGKTRILVRKRYTVTGTSGKMKFHTTPILVP